MSFKIGLLFLFPTAYSISHGHVTGWLHSFEYNVPHFIPSSCTDLECVWYAFLTGGTRILAAFLQLCTDHNKSEHALDVLDNSLS